MKRLSSGVLRSNALNHCSGGCLPVRWLPAHLHLIQSDWLVLFGRFVIPAELSKCVTTLEMAREVKQYSQRDGAEGPSCQVSRVSWGTASLFSE